MNEDYNNKTLDHIFGDIKDSLNRIEAQTIRHNGRLTRLEKIMLILGTAVVVVLVVNGSELVNFISLII